MGLPCLLSIGRDIRCCFAVLFPCFGHSWRCSSIRCPMGSTPCFPKGNAIPMCCVGCRGSLAPTEEAPCPSLWVQCHLTFVSSVSDEYRWHRDRSFPILLFCRDRQLPSSNADLDRRPSSGCPIRCFLSMRKTCGLLSWVHYGASFGCLEYVRISSIS